MFNVGDKVKVRPHTVNKYVADKLSDKVGTVIDEPDLYWKNVVHFEGLRDYGFHDFQLERV
jgi:hypothetical protein